MENYFGFYTSKPFWAGPKPEFNDPKNFKRLMEEEVFIYEGEGYRLKICKDGMFIFGSEEVAAKMEKLTKAEHFLSIEQQLEFWSIYLDYLNCIYLLFESAVLEKFDLTYFEISEITNKDAFVISFKNGRVKSFSVSELSVVYNFQKARYLSFYKNDLAFPNNILADDRIYDRIEIPKEVFDLLHINFSKVFKDFDKVKILSDLLKGLGEYKIGNYPTSLILSWFIIESYLIEKWKNFLNLKNIRFPGGMTRINAERRRYFEGRDYPINIILNMLELSDVIEFEKYKIIDEIRDKRNSLVHKDKSVSCDAKDCQKAFSIITAFIEEDMGISVLLNSSYSISGL